MILQATISHLPRAGQLFPWVVGPWVRRHLGSQNAPWAGTQLGLGSSCGWYQIRHLLMTATTNLPLCPSSWWKGEGASSPALKERMQRFRGQTTIPWPRDEMRFLSYRSSAPHAHSSALQRPTTAPTKRALSPRHTTALSPESLHPPPIPPAR